MSGDSIAEFAAGYPFELDGFQLDALRALARGESVLVAAPTGSGKTLVAEFAVWLAVAEGGKAFYTTPLKALSNQKFGDLIAEYGAENVGLLTGDNSINANGAVVVMTTEVLRNMIYERSDLLRDLRYVVLDEVHYLQDPYRGAVWEEIIIHLPLDVSIVSLSATVSNAEEFAEWIQTLRGTTAAVIEEKRPVTLRHHYLLEGRLLPMFTTTGGDPSPNTEVMKIERRTQAPKRSRGDPRRRRRARVRRTDVATLLQGEGMLPAIYFIFSRKGCTAAVGECVREGISLTSPQERRRIREYASMRCAHLDEVDLEVLGYHEWLDGLVRGVASHHAGMLPVFKETVEELFQAGLVKLVFATETLSLGINMPARSVFIESLTKFTGERHEVMTPGEFTQLTGRAGRRGIDTLGHAVVPQQRDIPFQQIAGLASTRTYTLVSSFAPSYNMATNLVRNYTREEADHLLNTSFAQYRVDKDVVVLERLIERNETYLASYREKMTCEKGDFDEYWRMTERIRRLERSLERWEETAGRDQTRTALSVARPGQVYVVPTGKLRGPVVIVGHERSKRGEPRVLALTRERRLVRLGVSDFSRPPRPVANLAPGGARDWPAGRVDHETRKRLAGALEALELPAEEWWAQPLPEEREGTELAQARTRIHSHACHRCPDRERHAQWAQRAMRLEGEIQGLQRRVRARTETLSRRFERVLGILDQFGYVEGFSLTEKGWALARIYNESDLVVAESLAQGWLHDLEPAELAAMASAFVFESRGPIQVQGALPTERLRDAHARVRRFIEGLKLAEERAGLDLTRVGETGFADVIYRWCQGADLEDVLNDTTPGDFIRGCKQSVDLLRQMSEASSDEDLNGRFAAAVAGVNRGVVAYTGLI